MAGTAAVQSRELMYWNIIFVFSFFTPVKLNKLWCFQYLQWGKMNKCHDKTNPNAAKLLKVKENWVRNEAIKYRYTKCKKQPQVANHEVWNFLKLVQLTLKRQTKHPRPPDHPPPLTLSLSHSLTLLSLPKKTTTTTTKSEIKEAASHCLLYAHSSHDERWWLFLNNSNDWSSYEHLTTHKKSHR